MQVAAFIATLVFTLAVIRSECNHTTGLDFILAETSCTLATLVLLQIPFSLLATSVIIFAPFLDLLLGGLGLGAAVLMTLRRYKSTGSTCSNQVRNPTSNLCKPPVKSL